MSLTAGLFNSGIFNVGLFNGGIFNKPSTLSLESLFSNGEAGVLCLPLDLSMLWQDTAGTVPATAAGQLVARIDDKSGNGNHCIQATTSAQPALQQTAGGLWYLAFDGIEDLASTAAATVTGVGDSFFAALGVRGDALTGYAALRQMFGIYKSSVSFSGFLMRISSFGRCTFGVRYSGESLTTGPFDNSSLTDLEPHVVAGGYDGSVIYNRTDGAELTPPTARTPTANEAGYFIIGSTGIAAPYSFFGGLYVVTDSISPEMISLAEQTIADLCGVTLQ